jgi:hypothetical protein
MAMARPIRPIDFLISWRPSPKRQRDYHPTRQSREGFLQFEPRSRALIGRLHVPFP